MAKKFIYVNTNGNYEETQGAYESADFIASTAGAADAGKPIKTDASGLVDASFINQSAISHSNLSNLSADDHVQYLLATGARNLTGKQSYASHPTFSADTELVDKKYVDDMIAGDEWYNSVLTRTATPPASPATGARYMIIPTATGAWVGKEQQIAQWSGSAWVYTVPTVGGQVSVDDETDGVYLFTGTVFEKKQYEATTASNGLVKVGVDVRIDASAAGAGLGFAAGVLSVNVDNASLEITGDSLNVKAAGIKDSMIDFGTGAGQVSGGDIPIVDAAGYFFTNDVESALAELGAAMIANGTSYIADTGGVTKGDLVYISANDKVKPYSTLTQNHKAIGLAYTNASAGNTVQVLANDTILPGILSSATAGDVYYWNGSALSTSIPGGGGAYVVKCGVAKNATDLHVEIETIKKNS